MFGKVVAFEVRYQLRQPLFWIISGFFFLIAFAMACTDVVRIGGLGNAHRNGPYMAAFDHLVLSMFYIFATAAFVAGAILRDDETGFGPILRATRLSKAAYLYGRFAGAAAASALAFLAVPLAILVGSLMPWVDPDSRGPFLPGAYLFPYLALATPTILFTGALFLSLAAWTRSLASTFIGVIGLLIVYVAGRVALGKLDLEHAAALLDPFGLQTFGLITRYWTASERNALVPALEGVLLWNRLGVLAASAALLALAYPLYRPAAQPGAKVRADARGDEAAPGLRATAGAGPRRPTPTFDGATARAQLLARTRLDMQQVFGSPVFLILLGLGLLNALISLSVSTGTTSYGGALWPVTRVMITILQGAFTFFPMIIAIFFAGELVWRERDRRTHEIIDATPVPDWAFVAPKTLAVGLVLLATLLVSVVAAIAVQLFKGYTDIELGKYLLWYVAPEAADLLLIAALGVFLQAISPNKFVGWGLMVAYIIATIALPNWGLEHNLYLVDNAPPVPLSDMNGQGFFWKGAWWFRLYWGAFSLMLLVLAYGLWRRGSETRFLPRLRRLPRKLGGRAGAIGAAALVVFAGAGVFIFINTNVWNHYRTTQGDEAFQAAYERALLRYENTPQPTVVSVALTVNIHPKESRVETTGVYVLENRTDKPLTEVHVRFDRDVTIGPLTVDQARGRTAGDPAFNYRIFTFDGPLLPGQRRTLTFSTELGEQGFRNAGNLTSVANNGTFLNSDQIAPVIGMSRDSLLTDHAARVRQKLPPTLHQPPLNDDPAARQYTYVGHAGWTTSDITVVTDADQTPIAPGDKVSDITRDGRRTAEFRTTAPILQFFSVQSARYLVRTETYKGVRFSVFYDPHHPYNTPRMIAALKASLDYYQANFSPYQFREARITEFPDYQRFAQSFAGTFAWSEGMGFIADYRDPRKIDLVTYIAAHEFAHQWWAHQMIGADQQGATALSETLAQYSALRVMRTLYGPDQIRKFLKFELDAYLRGRGSETSEEQPLATVEKDQGYIHYRKGSLVMYRLADEIGEDKVNAALRSLLAQFAFKGPPYPTSRELEAALLAQAPDRKDLIHDLFDVITLYDVKTTAATSRRRADGRYDVAVTVQARKLLADGNGKETEETMSEPLWVGLFDAKPDAARFGARNVIALERRPVHSGVQTLTFVAARPPAWAGADPYNELIDRNSDDNLVAVK